MWEALIIRFFSQDQVSTDFERLTEKAIIQGSHVRSKEPKGNKKAALKKGRL